MSKKGLYLFAGALAGFVAGICFAPKEGSETRKDAKEKLKEVKENPKDVLHETFDGVKEKIISIKEEIKEDNNIEISEEDILISKSFDEGESK
ncbi:MAG: YtxH domain-containing protein [Terrisporobacter sp.]|uniref:YtxH domain-containing protein n=1 Tax=Terrisporobacter sp. TaxID=1965305 RepID=UPI002FC6790C